MQPRPLAGPIGERYAVERWQCHHRTPPNGLPGEAGWESPTLVKRRPPWRGKSLSPVTGHWRYRNTLQPGLRILQLATCRAPKRPFPRRHQVHFPVAFEGANRPRARPQPPARFVLRRLVDVFPDTEVGRLCCLRGHIGRSSSSCPAAEPRRVGAAARAFNCGLNCKTNSSGLGWGSMNTGRMR
jgi:hypothetical protein